MSQSSHFRDRPFRRWIPSTSLNAWKQEVNELVENLIGDPLSQFRNELPRIDVAETATALEVTVDVPGYSREQIQLELDDQSLHLKGSREMESATAPEDVKYHRVERREGSFARSIWLPCSVDESKIEAKLSNGVLKIRLPKSQESCRRKVEIQDDQNVAPPFSG